MSARDHDKAMRLLLASVKTTITRARKTIHLTPCEDARRASLLGSLLVMTEEAKRLTAAVNRDAGANP